MLIDNLRWLITPLLPDNTQLEVRELPTNNKKLIVLLVMSESSVIEMLLSDQLKESLAAIRAILEEKAQQHNKIINLRFEAF